MIKTNKKTFFLLFFLFQVSAIEAAAVTPTRDDFSEILDLSGGRLHDTSAIESSLSEAEKYTVLNLSNNHLTRIPKHLLERLVNLRALILHGNPLNVFDEPERSLLGKIEMIDISSCKLDDSFFSQSFMRSLPYLKTMNASDNELTVFPPVSLCSQLTILDLSHNNIRIKEKSDSSDLRHLTQLKALNLSHNNISTIHKHWLPRKTGYGAQVLILDNNNLTSIPHDLWECLAQQAGTIVCALNNPDLSVITPALFSQRITDDDEIIQEWCFREERDPTSELIERSIFNNSATTLAHYMIKKGVANTQEHYLPWLLERKPVSELETGSFFSTPGITLRRNKVKVALGAAGAAVGGAAAVAYGPALLIKFGLIESAKGLGLSEICGIGGLGGVIGGGACAGVPAGFDKIFDIDIEKLAPEPDIITIDGCCYVLKKNIDEYRAFAQTTMLLSCVRIYLATISILFSKIFDEHYITSEEHNETVKKLLSILCLNTEESAVLSYSLERQSEPEFMYTLRKLLPKNIALFMKEKAPEGTYSHAPDDSLSSMKIHAKEGGKYHTIRTRQVCFLYEQLQQVQSLINLLHVTITNRYYGNNIDINIARIRADASIHADAWTRISTVLNDMRTKATECGITRSKSISDILLKTSIAATEFSRKLRSF